jgi:hypothetical protein
VVCTPSDLIRRRLRIHDFEQAALFVVLAHLKHGKSCEQHLAAKALLVAVGIVTIEQATAVAAIDM